MEYYAFMGKVVVMLLVLIQVIYVLDLVLKKIVPPLKSAWQTLFPVMRRFRDQVLIPAWVKILKKWRARK